MYPLGSKSEESALLTILGGDIVSACLTIYTPNFGVPFGGQRSWEALPLGDAAKIEIGLASFGVWHPHSAKYEPHLQMQYYDLAAALIGINSQIGLKMGFNYLYYSYQFWTLFVRP
ncbi:hypothetical protein EV426DRAFT_577187 [Tirmania nivea]|nr:hypothetical protein EV426DRAFT_577187 [Tirmania nivea]